MSSWANNCCKYTYPKTNNETPPSEILRCRVGPSLLAGGSTDQERMSSKFQNCSSVAPAYATGGNYRDSSFLTMKYAMQASRHQSLNAPAVNRPADKCCPKTPVIGVPNMTNTLTQYAPSSISFNSSANNYTYDRILSAKIGGAICNVARD